MLSVLIAFVVPFAKVTIIMIPGLGLISPVGGSPVSAVVAVVALVEDSIMLLNKIENNETITISSLANRVIF